MPTNDIQKHLPKFDNRARNALSIAQQVSMQIGHNFIGSEHLLFGILSQPQDGLPFQVTFMDNFSNQELFRLIKEFGDSKMKEEGVKEKSKHLIPEVTSELQKCVNTAIQIADKYNYNYIGIEHLIYGILELKSSRGQALMNLPKDAIKRLKEVLLNVFQSYSQGDTSYLPRELDYENFESNTTQPKSIGSSQTPNSQKIPHSKASSALKYFTNNLNQKVEKEKGFDLISRDREVVRLIQILSRKNKNNPIIVGEPGIGKTALVEGLAKKINSQEVPSWLQNKTILTLDITSLLAGSIFRGEFEQRIKTIIEEVVNKKNIILFIDELHTVIGAGSGGSQSGPEMSAILKPYLARGEISIIGATTADEYRTVIRKDKAFERRFQMIRLEEPTNKETIDILKGIKNIYEKHHQSQIPDKLLPKLVELCERFLPERRFPDKAIDVLDESLVRARLIYAKKTQDYQEKENAWQKIEEELLYLIKAKNKAIVNKDLVLSKKYSEEQKTLEDKLVNINLSKKEQEKQVNVTQHLLENAVSQISGVPLARVSSSVYTKIKKMEDGLNHYIFGQTDAVKEITSALKRSYAGVNPHKGPIASFLLLGPTGVGKTEMVKVLTKELYGSDKYLLKLDMSEFREKHQMSRLLGAPAGYVGYDDAPQLTEFLRKNPYSVILFDEIEKGHPENLNILLQMLEDGIVTDAKGNKVSCEHVIVFLTSNLGKSQFNKFASKIGFLDMDQDEETDYQTLKQQVMDSVEKEIKPEILGRLTAKIVFRPISKQTLSQIIAKELQIIQKHMLTKGVSVKFEVDKIVDYLYQKIDYKVEYGAREVKSIVAKEVQDCMAEFLLDHPLSKSMFVQVKKQKVLVGK